MKPLSVWTYVFSLGLWLSLCFGAAAIVVELNIREAEKGLTQYGDAYSSHLDKAMVSSEAVLKGFSALFGSVGTTDPAKVARYVQQVVETNPHIFALEIIQAVSRNQLAGLVARKKRDGVPDFTIKSFSYDSDRKWQAPKDKAFYYPIVFTEPMLSGSEDILGLDVESIPLLQQTMSESLRRRVPVASHPFRLVQGNLAYIVFCPIGTASRTDGASPASGTQDELVVDMVIDVARLAGAARLPAFDGGAMVVHHKDFSPDDPRGQLLTMSGKARSPIERAIFPRFEYKKTLATMDGPFSLVATRQLGWSDLSLWLLALMAALTFMSSLMLVAYLRAHQQGRILDIENQQRLWQLANHDSLTGLPNRMLLMDRMEQLLSRMRRQGKQLAVIFLDIDDFKQVNDAYGHDIGDQLLRFVAERLQTAIRVDDTVARLGGDEFVILIEGMESVATLGIVNQKIRQKLTDGFMVDGQLIRVRASIGIAISPEDGDSPEALLKQADMRMYADKKIRAARIHLA